MSSSGNKRVFVRGISVAAMAAALAVASPALAQTTGTIRGDNAAVGSTVTVTDLVTGRSVTTTVNADGTFVIVGLRPSTYRVEGAGATREITVPVGATVTIDPGPEVAESGTIVVTGRRDRNEVRTATIGTSVSQTQMQDLPQNDRNFLNFAGLAPGVTVSNDPNNKRIQAGGVSSENVNVYIDGSSHKNQVGFGGVAGQNFSQGNPFPQSAVQEFRVETQNFKAEYEQAGSAIITAVTRTGGQDFHGGAFVEFMPREWFGRPFFDRRGEANNRGFPCADNPANTCYNPQPDFRRFQFGGDLGGPIIPDVLHFFASYEGTRQANPSITVNLLDPEVPENLRQANVGSVANDFEQDLFFGKLTLFASSADTIHLSGFRRNENDIRDYGGIELREHGRNIGTSTDNYQLEWAHRADNWLNELTLSYQNSFTGTPTLTEGSEYVLTNTRGNNILIGGAHFFEQANEQTAYTFRNHFTYTGFDGHVIKAGVRISDTTLVRVEDAFANGSYVFGARDFTGVDSSTPYRATISILPPTPLSASNTQIGLFVQDDWTIDDHWTVNAGLRWDYESNNFNNNFVTPERVATALRNYQPWRAAGIDPEDYISDGTERDPFLGAFQPRLGISYDVHGDRDLVFFAGAGRYYDRNIFYLASLETLFNTVRSDVTVQFCDRVAGNSVPDCAPVDNPNDNVFEWNPAYRDPQALREAAVRGGLSGDIWVLNDDTPVPYTDQFTFGVRKRLGDIQLSAALAHNRSHNGFIYVRGNRTPDGQYTEGGDAWVRDNFPPEGRPAGYTGRLNIGSSEGEFRYTALYLTADRPYTQESGWGVTASLTISDSTSNQGISFGEGQMFNAGRQDAYGWQNTRGLERWRFVGSGIVDLPFDFRASATLTLASGPSFGQVDFSRPAPPNCGGCFYYNDAGVFFPEKDIAFKNLDVRLARSFRTPWGHEVTAEFEVFNLFDWVNRSYSTWGAGFGPDAPGLENGTVGQARSFQAGLRYRF